MAKAVTLGQAALLADAHNDRDEQQEYKSCVRALKCGLCFPLLRGGRLESVL
jgi:hypothetical protein